VSYKVDRKTARKRRSTRKGWQPMSRQNRLRKTARKTETERGADVSYVEEVEVKVTVQLPGGSDREAVMNLVEQSLDEIGLNVLLVEVVE